MYSIKTDLGVSGDVTINKDLLINGNAVVTNNMTVGGTITFADAVFTQITITGSSNLADINSTGTASLNDLNVAGNTTLGDSDTDTVTVNGTSTFNSAITATKDLTVQGNTTIGNQSTDTLNVIAGATFTNPVLFNGNVTIGDNSSDSLIVNSTANLKNNVTIGEDNTDILTINSTTSLNSDLIMATGTSASFDDVTINGVLGGTFTVSNGTFGTLTVTGQSNLNSIVLSGNVTGTTRSATFQTYNVAGSAGIIQFSYNDPARPSDIKSAIEPYKISSSEFQGQNANIDHILVGDVTYSDFGLTAKGKASIDYLDIVGNSTTGTSRPQLTVAGTSTFTGKVTVGDLDITGAVSGLTFSDVNANSLTVTGQSNLNSIVLSGNVTGTAQSATFQTYNVAGSAGIIQFSYNDPARPSDIKSAIEPYKISSSEFQGQTANLDYITVGDVTFANPGLTAAGIAKIDYLDIVGNSTTGTSRSQLTVAGKTTLNDLEVTGTVSGITFDLTGQDIHVNSLTSDTYITATGALTVGAGITVTGASTFNSDVLVEGQTLQVKDLIVTGTTTGVTAQADVDGLDIAPNSVAATTTVSVGTDLTVTGETTTGGLTVNGVIGGLGGNAVIVSGLSTAGAITTTKTGTALDVTNNAHIGGTLTVDGNTSFGGSSGQTTIHNLVVTGTTTGVTAQADVDGLDIAPNSVNATTSVKGNTLESTTTTVVGTNLTVGGTAGVGTNLTVGGTATVTGDMTVNGTFTPAGGLDLSTSDVTVNSLSSTGNTTVGGNLAVTGNVTGTLKTTNITNSGTLAVTGGTTLSTVSTSGLATLNSATVTGAATFNGNITSANTTVAIAKSTAITGDLSVSGTLTAGGIDLSGTAISAASLSTTGNVDVGGNLTVAGTFDLSSTAVSAASLASTGNTTVGGNLVLTTGVITGAPQISGNTTVGGTLGVTGATTLAGVTATTLTVPNITGNTTFANNVTVTGTFTPSGGLNLSGADISANSIALAASATVGTTLNVTGTTTLGVVNSGNHGITGTLNVSGVSTMAAVSATNITASGTLGVTGNTTLNGTLTVNNTGISLINHLQVGTGTPNSGMTLDVFGDTTITGNLAVTGTINAAIDLTSRDISPRNITASGDISAAGSLTAGTSLTAATAIIGQSGSTNNNLQVNGNMVVTGVINGTFDQSSSDVVVNSLGSKTTVNTSGKLTVGTAVSGSTPTGGIDVLLGNVLISQGNLTLTLGNLVVSAGTSTLTGATTIGANGTAASTTSLTVNGSAAITGNISGVNGTFSGNTVARKYSVTPNAKINASTVGSTWTPDGNSNVYYITLDQATTTIAPISGLIGGGKAASIVIYLQQDATGGRTATFDGSYAIVGGTQNTNPNAVTIVQVIYDGFSSVADTFLAQRTA